MPKALCRVLALAEQSHYASNPLFVELPPSHLLEQAPLWLRSFEHRARAGESPANAKRELTWSRGCSVRSLQEDLRLFQHAGGLPCLLHRLCNDTCSNKLPFGSDLFEHCVRATKYPANAKRELMCSRRCHTGVHIFQEDSLLLSFSILPDSS